MIRIGNSPGASGEGEGLDSHLEVFTFKGKSSSLKFK